MGRSPSPVVRRREEKRDREERRVRPRRHRSRSRSRDRRDRRRSAERRRSASPARRRRVSRSPDPTDLPGTSAPPKRSKKRGQDRPTVTQADLEGKSPEEQEMLRVMGFCGFDTTKGKKVEDNDAGDVHVVLKRKYRQYMNRKGGFNRPLDFVA